MRNTLKYNFIEQLHGMHPFVLSVSPCPVHRLGEYLYYYVQCANHVLVQKFLCKVTTTKSIITECSSFQTNTKNLGGRISAATGDGIYNK